MAASSPRYGPDCYVYLNTGTYNSPTWTSCPFVRDVTLNAGSTEGDVSSRSVAIKKTAKVMRDFSVDVDAIWDDTNTQFQSMLDAYNGSPGATVPALILDGAVGTAGNEGLRAHMSVMQITRNEPLEGAVTASIQLKPGPCASTEEPAWYTSA